MRRSIDARNDILYRYRVEVCRPDEVMDEYVLEDYKDVSAAEPIVIVGAGESHLILRYDDSYPFTRVPSFFCG